jgi:uncharacterized membrane protein
MSPWEFGWWIIAIAIAFILTGLLITGALSCSIC